MDDLQSEVLELEVIILILAMTANFSHFSGGFISLIYVLKKDGENSLATNIMFY